MGIGDWDWGLKEYFLQGFYSNMNNNNNNNNNNNDIMNDLGNFGNSLKDGAFYLGKAMVNLYNFQKQNKSNF